MINHVPNLTGAGFGGIFFCNCHHNCIGCQHSSWCGGVAPRLPELKQSRWGKLLLWSIPVKNHLGSSFTVFFYLEDNWLMLPLSIRLSPLVDHSHFSWHMKWKISLEFRNFWIDFTTDYFSKEWWYCWEAEVLRRELIGRVRKGFQSNELEINQDWVSGGGNMTHSPWWRYSDQDWVGNNSIGCKK